MDVETIKSLHNLHDVVEKHTAQYFHTKPLVESTSSIVLPTAIHSFEVTYGLKDLLLIGAVTESPVLMTGGTDLGKTTLAKLVMNALFGNEKWHILDFDLDFGKDAYTDINSDFFHEKGKKLADLYSLHGWMLLPGFIADELNGAHAKVARKALHIIKEKDITLPDGRRAQIGHQLEDGGTYQFQIATINEGKDYSGTFDMDKALRRRTTIEIPMDIFKPTPTDRLLLQRSGRRIEYGKSENHLTQILQIFGKLNDMKVHPVAEMFLAYLEAFDYCKHSLTKEKCSIESKNGSIYHVCTQPIRIGESAATSAEPVGCVFLKSFANDMCPNVNGITPGISTNLVTVARAFAALRAVKFTELVAGFLVGQDTKPLSYKLNNSNLFRQSMEKYVGECSDDKKLAKKVVVKYIETLEVQQCDILAAAPFVAYSKLGISPVWILKHFQGNRFGAVSTFIREANIKFKEGLSRPEFEQSNDMNDSQKLSSTAITELKDYCDADNPWLWRVVSPYFVDKITSNDVQSLYDE